MCDRPAMSGKHSFPKFIHCTFSDNISTPSFMVIPEPGEEEVWCRCPIYNVENLTESCSLHVDKLWVSVKCQ